MSDTCILACMLKINVSNVYTFNPLTAKLFNLNFHPLNLCPADAIHNFKWLKIIQI